MTSMTIFVHIRCYNNSIMIPRIQETSEPRHAGHRRYRRGYLSKLFLGETTELAVIGDLQANLAIFFSVNRFHEFSSEYIYDSESRQKLT